MSIFDNAEVFRQFVDLLPFGAYIADPRRKVLYWNRRAEQITGFLAHEVVGRSCADGILEHCTPGGSGACDSGNCPLVRVVREGQPAESRLFLRHKQGHRLPVLVRALPLRDEHGKMTAIAEVFQEETVGPDGLCWITENIDRFDPQMGLPSIMASRAQLQLSLSHEEIHTVVFTITIEKLRDLAINRGREMANVAIRALAQTVSRLLTMSHYLGCWTEARLLVVVPHCHPDLMESLTQKLKDAGSSCGVVWWGERVVFKVAVNATMLEPQETLESLLARLEPQELGEK